MKRYLGILIFLSFTLLLCAQSIADVRTAQNIRYRGTAVKSSAHENWVFWEESSGSSYQVLGQKYDDLGNASFSSPITIPTGAGSVRIFDAVASIDNGIVLLLLQEPEIGQIFIKMQKINSQGQAQWTDSGILVSEIFEYKHPEAKLCANYLGGAYLLYRGEYSPNGYSLSGHNFDLSGNDIWTAAPTIPANDWYRIDQLLLTDAGELIINTKGQTGNMFRKVNVNGTIIGSDPLFPTNAVIPQFAKMQKGTDGNILIYSTDTDSGSPMLMQMMDANGNLLFSSLKPLPIGFTDASGDDLKFAALLDGGFILAHVCELSSSGYPLELRVQRLNAELEAVWGSENPLIFSSISFMMDFDMAVDGSENTWLSVVRKATNHHNDEQVDVIRLDTNGNLNWAAVTVSITGQRKFLPRFALLPDKAMLYWGDHNGDQLSILRQICTANGELILQTNGAQIRSMLSGNPFVYEVYSLGDKTICLMEDDRGRRRQIYYQILDSGLNPYMQDNGAALDPGEGRELRIKGAGVSPQNTLFVVYSKLNSNVSQELYLQEIDAAGNRLYPASGIFLGSTQSFYADAAIGFEDESAYVYWRYFRQSNSINLLSIKAQKIVAGTAQWEAGGLEIYDYPDIEVSGIDAHGRYLLFTLHDIQNGIGYVKALFIDPSGSIAANWPPQGLSVFDTEHDLNHYVFAQSGVIDDDLYCFVSGIEDEELIIKAQKLNVSGQRLWGDAGLQICTADGGLPEIDSLIFGDDISILYNIDSLTTYLQRLDVMGNMMFEEEALAMPGNQYYYNTRRLAQYANGSYSYFWLDGPEYAEQFLKHVYVNPEGSLQDTQLIYEADFDILHTAMCDNNAILYWTKRNSDIFSWDSYDLVSVNATALPEPVSNADITQELMPMVSLRQNTPNPFTGSTRISYKLREACPVKLQIFNIKGQLVQELAAMPKAAGEYSWDWDGTDLRGQKCAGGIYLYKINAATHSVSKKMVLLK